VRILCGDHEEYLLGNGIALFNMLYLGSRWGTCRGCCSRKDEARTSG